MRSDAADADGEADQGHQTQRDHPNDEPRRQGAKRRRAGQRTEREALVVRPAVDHAIDEDGAADDRRGEPVAGQQRHERRRAEGQAAEQARIEERIAHAQPADDGHDRRRPRPPRGAPTVTVAGSRPRPGNLRRPDERQADQPGDEGDPEPERTRGIHPAGPARRLPAGRRRPGEGQRGDPDRDVEVEDPAPGRGEDRCQRVARSAPSAPERSRHGRAPGPPRRPPARPPCPGRSGRR